MEGRHRKTPKLSHEATAPQPNPSQVPDSASAPNLTPVPTSDSLPSDLPVCGVPLCTIDFPGVSRPQCVKWSAQGQACIVTDSCLYILTPAIGYLKSLKPVRSSQVVRSKYLRYDRPPPRGKPPKAPIEFFECAIDIDRATAKSVNEAVSRPVDSNDYNANHPGQTVKTFKSVEWSPDGKELAFIDSDLNARILSAPENHLCGLWQVEHIIQPNASTYVTPTGRRRSHERLQVTCLAWSPEKHLAIGTRTGEVLIIPPRHISPRKDGERQSLQIATLGSEPAMRLHWSTRATKPMSRVVHDVLVLHRPPPYEVDMQLLVVQPSAQAVLYIVSNDLGTRLRGFKRSGDETPRCMQVSIAKLLDEPSSDCDYAISTTPGAVHVWIADQPRHQGCARWPQWQTCHLLPWPTSSEQTSRDNTAEAVAIERIGVLSYMITLKSGLQYIVPVPLPQCLEPYNIVRTFPESGQHFNTLEQRVESHQKVDGWDRDGPNGLIAVIQTAGDLSSFRLHGDRLSRFTLMLSPTPTSFLEEHIDALLVAGFEREDIPDERPHHCFRPLMALYHASYLVLKPALWMRIFDAVSSRQKIREGVDHDDLLSSERPDGEEIQQRLREWQRMYFITQWLERKIESETKVTREIKDRLFNMQKREEAKILTVWLVAKEELPFGGCVSWLSNEENERRRARVYLTAARLWFYFDDLSLDCSHVKLLQDRFDHKQFVRTELPYPMSGYDMMHPHWTFTQYLRDGDCSFGSCRLPRYAGYMKYSFRPTHVGCDNMHSAYCCSQTEAIILSCENRTCASCGKIAMNLAESDYPNKHDKFFRGSEACTYCGGNWIILTR